MVMIGSATEFRPKNLWEFGRSGKGMQKRVWKTKNSKRILENQAFYRNAEHEFNGIEGEKIIRKQTGHKQEAHEYNTLWTAPSRCVMHIVD